MNHCVLDPNLSFASQMLNSSNTIFDICHNFTIDTDVTIGDNCILRFNGGSLSGTNGKIIGNDIKIESSLVKIFSGISFEGNFLNGQIFEIEWFVDTYETSYKVNSTKDAYSELNAALNSGVKIMRFNNERYYPIQQTIVINGNLDIIGRTRYLDNATYFLKQPCIYSKYVTTLLVYNFNSGPSATPELIKTRLDINGLHFYCAKSYNNPISDDSINNTLDNIEYTPIVQINNIGASVLWGLHININITSINNQETQVPNWTGLEINATSEPISYIEIHGYVSMVYQAYIINNATTTWATDTKIFGNSFCVIGGVFNGGNPVRNYGTHQAISVFPNQKNYKSYFKAKMFENYGYVWDLGEKHNTLYRWSCNYIAVPIDESIGFTYDDTQQSYSPVSVEFPTDVFYPNLLADTYKYRHGLQDLTVTTVISHKENGVDVIDNLPFKRYEFPAYLMRSNNLAFHAAHHSDASFAWIGANNIKYKYKTTIVFSCQTMRLAYQDNPPLYIAPTFSTKPSDNKLNRFDVVVKYKDANNVVLKTLSFHFDPDDVINSISSAYYYGRYVKLRNIFMDGRISMNSKTEIEYTEYIEDQALFQRPVFFIPNYHADKIIRAGGDEGMAMMTEFDIGETYFHTTNGQLWWNGNKWTEYDGADSGIRRSGTLQDLPSSGIYIGFRYFCTSIVMIDGSPMINIELIYTGSNWVDALGRIVAN